MYGNDPVTSGENAVPWNELLDGFHKMQQPLMEGIESAPQATMDAPAPFSPTGNPDETIGSLLATLAFHEAYHAGQLGILRRITGHTGAMKGPQPETA